MNDTVRKAEAAAPQTVVNLWNLTVVCLLAWIVPGLGHFFLRRPKQGFLFLFALVFLFFWGLNLGAKIYQYQAQQPLTLFALFAQVGMGLPYFIARFIAFYAQSHAGSFFHAFAENFQFGSGSLELVTYEYGNTFTIVAGLLNFLVILDAYDIAVGRKKG